MIVVAAIFRSHAQFILHELSEFLGYSPPPLLERLIEDAQKIRITLNFHPDWIGWNAPILGEQQIGRGPRTSSDQCAGSGLVVVG